jgi:hypothetical protein
VLYPLFLEIDKISPDSPKNLYRLLDKAKPLFLRVIDLLEDNEEIPPIVEGKKRKPLPSKFILYIFLVFKQYYVEETNTFENFPEELFSFEQWLVESVASVYWNKKDIKYWL